MPTNTLHSFVAQKSEPKTSIIDDALAITGNVKTEGNLRLDGTLRGDIHCLSLIIGQDAGLEGNVVAEEVVIGGRLKGSVRTLHVTLKAKSHVEGELYHRSLTIEQGAYFEGKSRRVDNPLAVASEPRDGAKTDKPQLVYGRPDQHNEEPARVA